MDDFLALLSERTLSGGFVEILPNLTQNPEIVVADKAVPPLRIDIKYSDKNKQMSRRTIILQGISFYADGAAIFALCLAQRARRTFLMDRIEEVITTDGEILTASEYFFGRLGLDGAIQDFNFKKDLDPTRALVSFDRELFGAKLGILLIAARIDGELHPEEMDKILIFAERELMVAERSGALQVPFTIELMSAVEVFINNLYPQATNISDYVKIVNKTPKPDRHKFWRTFCDLISSDGNVSPTERKLVELVEAIQLKG